MILLCLCAVLSQWLHWGNPYQLKPLIVLVMALPALLWGVCYSEQQRAFWVHLALMTLAFLLPRTITISNQDVILVCTLALWMSGLLGLYLGKGLLKESL